MAGEQRMAVPGPVEVEPTLDELDHHVTTTRKAKPAVRVCSEDSITLANPEVRRLTCLAIIVSKRRNLVAHAKSGAAPKRSAASTQSRSRSRSETRSREAVTPKSKAGAEIPEIHHIHRSGHL